VIFFFFSSRRRHTRFDCDWSSDVCSSDLGPVASAEYSSPNDSSADDPSSDDSDEEARVRNAPPGRPKRRSVTCETIAELQAMHQIGRASCRERVENSAVQARIKR